LTFRWRSAGRTGQVMIAVGAAGLYGSYGLLTGQGNASTWSGKVAWAALGLAGMICSLIILGFGTRITVRIRRHRAQAITLDPDVADRDLVLYLRPFRADESLAHLSPVPVSGLASPLGSRRTQEEELAAAVRPLGRLVAVGRPGEPLPYLGAERGYLSADRWRDTVLRLLASARLVLLVAGSGVGLAWELAQAVTLLHPAQLILLVPLDKDGYAEFAGSSQGIFPRGLPGYAPGKPRYGMSLKAAVYFETDWTPRFVRLDVKGARANAFCQTESAFVYQLKHVYDALGAEWPGVRFWQPRHLSLTKRQLRMVVVAIPVIMLLMYLILLGVSVIMFGGSIGLGKIRAAISANGLSAQHAGPPWCRGNDRHRHDQPGCTGAVGITTRRASWPPTGASARSDEQIPTSARHS